MSRMKTYLGPKEQVTPDAIERFERQGGWAAEEKRDGCWAEIKTDDEGNIATITSRVGKLFAGELCGDLLGLRTHLPRSVLIGELEAASEAATERHIMLGYRRIHIFDPIIIGGTDLTRYPYEQRRRVVEDLIPSKDPEIAKRLCIVRQATKDFQAFYRDVMAEAGEGLVFKRQSSLYLPVNSDGKVDEWVRCKPYRFVDYVVMSIGHSPSGQPNLQVGLHIKGRLQRVCTIKSPPPSLLQDPTLIGSVVECKGAEVFKSGALRHGHFERRRPDKPAEDCTLEAAHAVAKTVPVTFNLGLAGRSPSEHFTN